MMISEYLSRTFASLTVRNYRLFFIGHGISVTGNWMEKLALAWLVLEMTDSGTWLGLAVAATQVPTLVLGTWTGVVADQHDKRTILMWVAVLGALPTLALAGLATIDDVDVMLVLLVALSAGVIDSFEKPARQAFPGDLVQRHLVPNAVSLNHVVQDIGKTIGPALAAWMIAVFGIPMTFVVNALTFLASFVGLILMRPEELQRGEKARGVPGQVRAGLSYVRHTPHLLGPIALLFIAGIFAYNLQVIMPLLAKDTFDGDATHAGYLLSSVGIGSIAAGLLIASVLKPTPLRIVTSAGMLGVTYVLCAGAPTFLIAVAVVAFVGGMSTVVKAVSGSWLQLAARSDMRGRVLSLLVIAIAGTTPIGAPLLGWLANELGLRLTCALAGGVTILAALGAYIYLKASNALRGPDLRERPTPADALPDVA